MIGTIVYQLTKNLSVDEINRQGFGEGLRLATDRLNEKNFYACNPSFDKSCGK